MASRSKKRKMATEPYIVLKQAYLEQLARHIPSDYHSLLIKLGMTDDEIVRIEKDNISSVKLTAFRGLLQWQRQFKDESEKYMIQCLKKALVSVGRNDLCQKLAEKKSKENLRRKLRKLKPRHDPRNKEKRQKHPSETKENEEEDDDGEYEGDEIDENDNDDENHGNDDNDDKDVDDDQDDDEDDDVNNDDDQEDKDDASDDDDVDDDDDDDDNTNEYFTAGKSIVAGVENTDKKSSILKMTTSNCLVESSVLLKVVSKSPLITYRQKEVIKYRLDLILTDGVTFIKGVAFEDHAHSINDKMFDGYVYKISKYRVKESNTVPAHMEVSLYDYSNIKVFKNVNRIKSPPVKDFTIKEIKQLKPIKQLVHLNPVIVCAVSEIEKPKIKHLRKVLLKDFTEKVVLNVWYDEDTRHVKFEHRRGDSVQATFVEVGEFVDEINLTLVGTSKMIKQEEKQMKKLLKNENRNIFIDTPMSIKEIFQLPYSQEIATINEVQVLTFKKERESEFVYRSCSIDSSHGKLIPKGRKKYCKKCGEYLKGEKKVELNAEIKDTSDSRTWIKIFDQCAKAILGNSYDTFLDCSHKERVSILKKIERNDALYFEFKVSVKKDKCNYKIIAKQVEII